MLNDRYDLTDRLGAGGTGEVFRAHDTRLDRVVAVKLLRSDAADASARARMEAEARLAGGLSHPGIARVLDYDESDEDEPRPFIVMEHVDGETLSAALRRDGAMSAEHAMRVVAEVAAALQVAHESGVVHRDVKPGNIMIDRTGRAVLVDFGIARSPSSEPLTSTGSILGTDVAAKAAAPMPVLARLRKCLRVRWRSGSGCMAVYSLVTVSSRLSSVLATVV